MPIKFLALGGRILGFRGGKCRFFLNGREDFSDTKWASESSGNVLFFFASLVRSPLVCTGLDLGR